MTKDEALKLALEALENGMKFVWADPEREVGFVAIDAIKEALDECDEDELIIQYHEATIKRLENHIDELMAQPLAIPIGYWHYGTGAFFKGAYLTSAQEQMRKSGALKRVYTAPPQRPWVGLTEVDVLAESKHWRNPEDFLNGVYWAETTLKERNT